MYAAYGSHLAFTISQKCNIKNKANLPNIPIRRTLSMGGAAKAAGLINGGQRGSLPTHTPSPLLFQWPPIPVSMYTSNLRLTMMNQDPKDLHTARLIIGELRAKVRYQAEHIMKWRKAYAVQVQLHYRYQKEKSSQMNALTSQLLLLESRLKRKQKQIAHLLSLREVTIQRQHKIIDTLSTRLTDNGLETIEVNYGADLDVLNDSDSAVVLEDIDSDVFNLWPRQKSSGISTASYNNGDSITIVRSISDAIETNVNRYSSGRRNNCFLRRPDILETVYSVEEDPEPQSDVAEKRDKFKNSSDKALSSSLTEGHIDNIATNSTTSSVTASNDNDKTKKQNDNYLKSHSNTCNNLLQQQKRSSTKLRRTNTEIGCTVYSVIVPQPQKSLASNDGTDYSNEMQCVGKSQITNFNCVMDNHRSVEKTKDDIYKFTNKVKSKSLEELRGSLVEHDCTLDPNVDNTGCYASSHIPKTVQSYA
ncbi:uncharacterized protein LOC119662785 [Teleopsis dalmanni]|uniref:uncharacterized protein LOC119662785 n=1 Tax=Teleopsis dalmanni TaxID=139649 RepID=UPI0018CE1B61|nr:uncharacterized protein LOC119662785 [Teleopsis dalmanni]